MADTIKSLTNIQKMPGAGVAKLVEQGDVIVTYKTKRIARLSKYSEAKPTEPGSPQAPPTSADPRKVLDLRNWTLMLPAGPQGKPMNDYPADFGVEAKEFFFVRDGGVVLRTPVTGVHSPNSKYPRTELREMKDDKWTKAAWSNASGVHTLAARLSVDHNLVAKPEVSLLQIHSGDDDVMQVRLGRGNVLEVWWNDGKSRGTLDNNYQLGSAHDFKIVATDKEIEVWYDGDLKTIIPKSGSGWYYKAGTYLQSTVSHGEKPDAWAEVTLYSLTVEHA